MQRSASLTEQIQQRLAGGDGAGEAVAAEAEVEGDAEGMEDGGTEVLGADRPVLHIGAVLVGLAVEPSTACAAAGDDGGAGEPVLASVPFVLQLIQYSLLSHPALDTPASGL